MISTAVNIPKIGLGLVDIDTPTCSVSVGSQFYETLLRRVQNHYQNVINVVGMVLGVYPSKDIDDRNIPVQFVYEDKSFMGVLSTSKRVVNQKYVVLIGPNDEPQTHQIAVVIDNMVRALPAVEISRIARLGVDDYLRKCIVGSTEYVRLTSLHDNPLVTNRGYLYRFKQFDDGSLSKVDYLGRRLALIEIEEVSI